ncbi:MAG TPA: prephenate dehydratase [Anditalea sp.]|nr:prephenate dehydratase [Anditalea sp.]
MKVAIQGIPGSFHHQVALNVFGTDIEILEFPIFDEVAKAVQSGLVDIGVMAIENSIAGAILPNYDLIDRFGLFINSEYYLPISHNLMALPGSNLKELKEVQSHPMALLQCQKYFDQYPSIKLTSEKDTASVAKKISEQRLAGIGAIASKKAAEIYGLDILAADIQSFQENHTRFILLKSKKDISNQIPSKSSLKITIKNKKGGLAQLLTTLAEHDLDLSKIQSIPVMERPWDYAFFIDVIISDLQKYKDALQKVEASGATIKILGEYKNQKP